MDIEPESTSNLIETTRRLEYLVRFDDIEPHDLREVLTKSDLDDEQAGKALVGLLHGAILEDDLKKVSMILEVGAKPDNYSMIIAAESADADILTQLLAAGGDPNSQEDFDSPLSNAILSDDITKVSVLLEAGAKPDSYSFACAAASFQSDAITQLLLAKECANDRAPIMGVPFHEDGQMRVVNTSMQKGDEADPGTGLVRPRLVLTALSHWGGTQRVLGEFDDVQEGRMKAVKIADYVEAHTLRDLDGIGEMINYRVLPDYLALDYYLKIHRQFPDGRSQSLIRVPSPEDRREGADPYPLSFDEAELQEAYQVVAFLGGKTLSKPLTELENSADQNFERYNHDESDFKAWALAQVEPKFARERAKQAAENLESRLPSAIEWAPPKRQGNDGPCMVIGDKVWNPKEEAQAQSPAAVQEAPRQRMRL